MKRYEKIFIGIVFFVVVIIFVVFPIINSLLFPNVQIISRTARTGNPNLDFTLFIDTALTNKGSSGDITLWARVEQGDNFWIKNQDVYIEKDETKNVTLEFKEIGFWSSENSSYNVWIE